MSDNIGTIIVLLLIAAACLGGGIWYKSNLLSKGKIINRPKDFVEYAELFTLKPITKEQFIAAVETQIKPNTRARAEGNSNLITMSLGIDITAELKLIEHTEEKSVYRFNFTHWKSKHGSPENVTEMNILLTTVEKMFIGIDPNTQVSTVRIDVKTKRSFI